MQLLKNYANADNCIWLFLERLWIAAVGIASQTVLRHSQRAQVQLRAFVQQYSGLVSLFRSASRIRQLQKRLERKNLRKSWKLFSLKVERFWLKELIWWSFDVIENWRRSKDSRWRIQITDVISLVPWKFLWKVEKRFIVA